MDCLCPLTRGFGMLTAQFRDDDILVLLCPLTPGLGMLAARFTDDDERGFAMSIEMTAAALGIIMGPSLGGILYQYLGWTTPLLIVSSFSLLEMILQVKAYLGWTTPLLNVSSFAHLEMILQLKTILLVSNVFQSNQVLPSVFTKYILNIYSISTQYLLNTYSISIQCLLNIQTIST